MLRAGESAAENGPALWATILAALPAGSIVAGGAVRDFLLGQPPKDIDVFLPVERWPASGLGGGFQSLGVDRNDEYAAMPAIQVVQRGTIAGHQVDVVGLWFGDADYSPERIVSTFDFAVSRSWFDGDVHDTPEARADREGGTVTLLLHDRPERAAVRFERLNARMGGGLTLIGAAAPEDVTQPSRPSDGEGLSAAARSPTNPNNPQG